MQRPRARGAAPHAQRQDQGPQEVDRGGAEPAQHGQRQGGRAVLQHIAGLRAFAQVLRIDQRVVPAAQGDALDLEALPFEREDLAPDEAVADLRVLIDQVGYFHEFDPSSCGCPARGAARMTLAGAPTAVAPSGTSHSTTAIAPILQPWPMRIPPSSWA